MKCPDCGYDSLPGADSCEDCGQDLTALDTPGARTEFETSLTEGTVALLGPKDPIFVPADATVGEAIADMCERRIGAVLVGSADDLRGILSERDVLLRLAHRFDEAKDSPVAEFMTTDPTTIELDAPIAFALNAMHNGDFRHLPVTKDGTLVGMISLRDVVQFLSNAYPDLIPAD